MNNADFGKLMERIDLDEMKLMHVKGADYSQGDVDRLGNFKQDAQATGLTKYQVWSILFNKHVKSVMKAIKENPESPFTKSEPLAGRLSDIRVYCKLMMAMLEEDLPKPVVRTVAEEILQQEPDLKTGPLYYTGINHAPYTSDELKDDGNGTFTVYQAICKCGFKGKQYVADLESANLETKAHAEAVL